MSIESAYEWLAPKLSMQERAALDTIYEAAKANPNPQPDRILSLLQDRLIEASRSYREARKPEKLDAKAAIKLIEAAIELAAAIESRSKTYR